jgi:hypothetical protein
MKVAGTGAIFPCGPRAQRVLEISLVMTVLVCYYNRNLQNIKNVRLPPKTNKQLLQPLNLIDHIHSNPVITTSVYETSRL